VCGEVFFVESHNIFCRGGVTPPLLFSRDIKSERPILDWIR
jgi:hypothetical protein